MEAGCKAGQTNLDAAKGLGKGKDFEAAQEFPGLICPSAYPEAQHAAESFLLGLCQLVLGVCLEAWPHHFGHFGVLRKERGHGCRVFLVCL
jgi:hypothetical protein